MGLVGKREAQEGHSGQKQMGTPPSPLARVFGHRAHKVASVGRSGDEKWVPHFCFSFKAQSLLLPLHPWGDGGRGRPQRWPRIPQQRSEEWGSNHSLQTLALWAVAAWLRTALDGPDRSWELSRLHPVPAAPRVMCAPCLSCPE